MLSRNNKGSVLIWAYFLIAALSILGVVFGSRAINENNIARRQRLSVQALHIAEAGMEAALLDLRLDYERGGTNPSWLDDWIYHLPDPISVPHEELQYPNWAILYNGVTLGAVGTYTVKLQSAGADKIWIKSTGTIGDTSRTIKSFATMFNINPWNNALFAGAGHAGGVMNGNINIRGSIHILGNGLPDPPEGVAMDLGGGAFMGNNYDNISTELSSRIPPCPTVNFGGENVQSLGAKIRVKKGKVNLTGGSSIGKENALGHPFIKETVDGSYVNDRTGAGWPPSPSKVYSDNGTSYGYDLGNRVSFPLLTPSYLADLESRALVINNTLNLTPDPSSNFSYNEPGKGSINLTNGVLAISGIVYVNGNLNTDKYHSADTILYQGIGSILVTGNVNIQTNFLTQGNNSFPSNIIGIMALNNITFNAANIDVTGLFYAGNTIKSQKQTDVAGAFMSNYFDMGTNVPSLYFVPEIINNLPPGLIGSEPIWYLYVIAWQRFIE